MRGATFLRRRVLAGGARSQQDPGHLGWHEMGPALVAPERRRMVADDQHVGRRQARRGNEVGDPVEDLDPQFGQAADLLAAVGGATGYLTDEETINLGKPA